MGATGAIHAKRILGEHGHQVIELERYSTCNKIWSTKVKRLRLPDLLCLRCGRRFEVRSKSALKITMSDSPTVTDRQWDYGLRNWDLVLLIACKKDLHTETWVPSQYVNAYSVGDLRATVSRSTLGPPKSASEGAERDRTWPSYVPSFDGQVVHVAKEYIQLRRSDGKQQTYNLARTGYHANVTLGQHFEAGAAIIASVVPRTATLACQAQIPYDFTNDLTAPDRETLYCAVKALGRLPEMGRRASSRLIQIARSQCDDRLVCLEAYASLARLLDGEGWSGLEMFLRSENPQLRMEAVLILGELDTPSARSLLSRVARDAANDSELRACAVWSLGQHRAATLLNELLPFFADPDRMVAVHAIAASLPHITSQTLHILLRHLGPPDLSAALVRALLETTDLNVNAVVDFLLYGSTHDQKPWLLYLLGLLGEEACSPVLRARGEQGRHVAQSLSLMWNQHKRNWTNTFAIQDLLEYTLRQNIRGT